MQKIVIVTPVYNDWESFSMLLKKTGEVMGHASIEFLAVNDGSTLAPDVTQWKGRYPVHLLHLNRNLGHQRAIACGICRATEFMAPDLLVVMDSDGEDRPEDLPALIDASASNDQKIVFARRSRREESFRFRFFYRLYKIIFRLLTGKAISFGNFSVIPSRSLIQLGSVSEIWNHYPGGVIKSRLPYVEISINRGKRYAGESRMNFTALVMHGLSAVSVHIETVAVRLLIFSFFTIVLSLLGIGVVFYLKFFTTLTFPNWASTISFGFASIIMQAFIISLFLAFTVLNYRIQKNIIPLKDYRDFVSHCESIS